MGSEMCIRDRFEITGGRLEVGGDGIGEMVDVRLRAVESVITTGRDD